MVVDLAKDPFRMGSLARSTTKDTPNERPFTIYLIVITRLKAKKYAVVRFVSRFFQLTQHLQTR
jgi:hypothetical protein